MSQPSPVRTAQARLAALKRWHPDDAPALAAARRNLDVAHASALTASAMARVRGVQR